MKKLLTCALLALSSIAFGATTVPVQLLNPSGSVSGQTIVSTGASSAPAWGGIGVSGIAAIAANTVVANATGSSASPTAFAMPSCSTANSALQYTSGTGFTCIGNSAILGANTFTAAQTVSFANATSSGVGQVVLNETSGSGYSTLLFNANAVPRWHIQKTAGGNFALGRYNAGTFVDNPISVDNTTGLVTLADALSVTGAVTATSTVQGSLLNSTGNITGPAAGYSITSPTGISSGGGIQLFDGTHGSQVLLMNAGNTVATVNGTGLTMGTGYAIVPASATGIKGTTTNDSPAAGSIGENPSNSTSGTSMSNNTPANCTSQSLTAGNWIVWGVVSFAPNAGTTVSQIVSGISTTSATLGANGTFASLQATLTTAASQAQTTPPVTLKLASTTTVYLIGQSQFATSTMTCSGNIYALRIR